MSSHSIIAHAFSYLQSMGCKGFVTSFSGMITLHGIIAPPVPINIEFASDTVSLPSHVDPFTVDHQREPFDDVLPNDLGDEPPSGESP